MKTIRGKNYLSTMEVAVLFGVDRRTIYRWIKKKREIFQEVEWFQYPTSGFKYFEEESVKKFIDKIVTNKKSVKALKV